MKNKADTSEKYIEQLEKKIVQLSAKYQNLSNEFNQYKKENKLLFGKLSHNLKNPVGVIYSFSEMMLENIENYDQEKLTKHTNVIHNSADYSIKLLKTFNKVSILSSDDFKLDIKYQNFQEFIIEVVSEAKNKYADRNIILNTNTPSNLNINFNYSELKIALENVIDNAVRYSNTNTEINILVSSNKEELLISVADEGIGIQPQCISKIFDNFFVVNTYDINNKKCLGLGLSIAKKIISQHKGNIEIESEPNKGTIVQIKIPI